MIQWLAMGGYARFVWPCYLLTAAVIVLNIYLARRNFADALRSARHRLTAKGNEQ